MIRRIPGAVLSLITSNLNYGHQGQQISQRASAEPNGILQGFTNGPILPTLDAMPFNSVIIDHNLDHQLFGKETYLHFSGYTGYKMLFKTTEFTMILIRGYASLRQKITSKSDTSGRISSGNDDTVLPTYIF